MACYVTGAFINSGLHVAYFVMPKHSFGVNKLAKKWSRKYRNTPNGLVMTLNREILQLNRKFPQDTNHFCDAILSYIFAMIRISY